MYPSASRVRFSSSLRISIPFEVIGLAKKDCCLAWLLRTPLLLATTLETERVGLGGPETPPTLHSESLLWERGGVRGRGVWSLGPVVMETGDELFGVSVL